MEFSEKLVCLRKQKQWTQQELADALFVSRTAVSKWESGRGYPNIDSLKQISKLFSVSVDELLSGDELITAAEENCDKQNRKTQSIVFGLADCMTLLMFILPMFGDKRADIIASVPLLSLENTMPYNKLAYIIFVCVSAALGIFTLALQNVENVFWQKFKTVFSLALTFTGLCLFILSQQPYAGLFVLFLLAFKGALLLKSR